MSWKDDLNYGLAAFGIQIPDHLPLDAWSARLGGKPARNTLVTVAASAILFHQFEKGHNPKVRDITDSLLYCSTCLSVGFAEIQPVTRAGKLLGSVLMTYGPSLTASLLDGPREEGDAPGEIVATLRKILAVLERQSLPEAAANSVLGDSAEKV